MDSDPLAFQVRPHRSADILVFARDQPIGILDHCHPRPEPAVHLGELQADVAAADDNQVLGHSVEIHHLPIGQPRRIALRRPFRDHRRAADIDDHLLGGESPLADLHGLGAHEAGLPEHELEPFGSRDPPRQIIARVSGRRRPCGP